MKRWGSLTVNIITTSILLSACHKKETDSKDCDQFWIDKMNEKWEQNRIAGITIFTLLYQKGLQWRCRLFHRSRRPWHRLRFGAKSGICC